MPQAVDGDVLALPDRIDLGRRQRPLPGLVVVFVGVLLAHPGLAALPHQQELVGPALVNDLALAHQIDAVGDPERESQVLLY